VVPYSFTQDTAGPITRTVADAAHVLDAIAGYDPRDAATAAGVGYQPKSYTAYLDPNGLKGARIGVLKSFFGNGPEHQETNAVIERAMESMRRSGATLVTIDDPIDDPIRVFRRSWCPPAFRRRLRRHRLVFLSDLNWLDVHLRSRR
jgi:Asp-tRNA(Asn)/Glu-tRNA(Gln) amidotransferase A subunit family amidase